MINVKVIPDWHIFTRVNQKTADPGLSYLTSIPLSNWAALPPIYKGMDLAVLPEKQGRIYKQIWQLVLPFHPYEVQRLYVIDFIFSYKGPFYWHEFTLIPAWISKSHAL